MDNTKINTTLDTNEYDENDDLIFTEYMTIPRNLWYMRPDVTDRFDIIYNDIYSIARYYHRYKHGVKYKTKDHIEKRREEREDGKGFTYSESIAYDPSCMHYRRIAQLINKQARFLFGKEPDIELRFKMDLGDENDKEQGALDVTQEMLNNILETNAFYSKLYTASKDCAIGKRIACVVNFNPDAGVTIDFLSAFHFVYEYDEATNRLKMFAFFREIEIGTAKLRNESENCRTFIKKLYTLEKRPNPEYVEGGEIPQFINVAHIEEMVYNELGEIITDEYEADNGILFHGDIDLDFIPAEVIINDGLLDEVYGVSDVGELEDYESWYNTLNCLLIDAMRKNMNPMKYTVDMDNETTKHMTSAIGGYADLMSDHKDPESQHPDIGLLESSLTFAEPLAKLVKEIRKGMYDFVDVPDIDIETMSGVLTSGKALKALYWGLITRCDEKMKVWKPGIQNIIEMVIRGCYKYQTIASRYLGLHAFPKEVEFEVEVTRNNPLPEDEEDEKTIDMREVDSDLMSRKSYLMKWRNMNDAQAQEELLQIAKEKALFDDLAIPQDSSDDDSTEDGEGATETLTEGDDSLVIEDIEEPLDEPLLDD